MWNAQHFLLSIVVCWHLLAFVSSCLWSWPVRVFLYLQQHVLPLRRGNLCMGSLTAVRHKRVTEGEIAGEMNFVLLSLSLSPSLYIFASLKLLHNFARDLIKVAQISLRIRRIVPGTSNEAIRLHWITTQLLLLLSQQIRQCKRSTQKELKWRETGGKVRVNLLLSGLIAVFLASN